MSGPSLLRRRKRRRRRLLLGQGSILLNLILLYWTCWCRVEKLVERSSLLHFSCWYSKLFESSLSRLSEHFEASGSISPFRSISLAFGPSSLLPPVRVCHYALSSSIFPFLFRLSLHYHMRLPRLFVPPSFCNILICLIRAAGR